MSFCYNAASQRFSLPERPLEPPDCWGEEPDGEGDVFSPFDEYDRVEDEMRGIYSRR